MADLGGSWTHTFPSIAPRPATTAKPRPRRQNAVTIPKRIELAKGLSATAHCRQECVSKSLSVSGAREDVIEHVDDLGDGEAVIEIPGRAVEQRRHRMASQRVQPAAALAENVKKRRAGERVLEDVKKEGCRGVGIRPRVRLSCRLRWIGARSTGCRGHPLVAGADPSQGTSAVEEVEPLYQVVIRKLPAKPETKRAPAS